MGPSLPAIKTALDAGNIREVWGLMYVLTKTQYFSTLMLALLSAGPHGQPPLATPSSLAVQFGMDASALASQWRLVTETHQLNSTDLMYSQGTFHRPQRSPLHTFCP